MRGAGVGGGRTTGGGEQAGARTPKERGRVAERARRDAAGRAHGRAHKAAAGAYAGAVSLSYATGPDGRRLVGALMGAHRRIAPRQLGNPGTVLRGERLGLLRHQGRLARHQRRRTKRIRSGRRRRQRRGP